MSRFMMLSNGALRPLSFDGGRAEVPILTSAASGFRGVPFEVHRTHPFIGERNSGPPSGQLTLIVVLEGTTKLVFRKQAREVEYTCLPGTLSVHTPADRPRLLRVTGSAKLIAVRVADEYRDRLLQDGAPLRPGFQPPMAADPTLRDLGLALCREAASGAQSGTLFADSLSLAFLSYALDKLPDARMQAPVRGVLSDGQQRRLRRYIEERLHEELRVAELAALCGLRNRQFSSSFKRSFGKSPYRYVLDRRLARGAEWLGAHCEIAEVAHRLGFSSASHFATEFRRSYGMSPSRYARNKDAAAET